MAKVDELEQGAVLPTICVERKRKVVRSGGFTYIGYALPGTATSAAKWRAIRFEEATGNITHADGNLEYDNIADNLASLTYS